ncbi:MAG: Hsp20/alpha crystallin family protein [Propionibacteriaceae bacterium]|nr:Hsp20/alpha crystallin family protein [Propionibacteriaceae bacterium]
MPRFPFDSLSQLQAELDRFFGKPLVDSGLSGASVYPLVNVFTDANGMVVRAEVPGIPADKLSVQVEAGQLTISGERPMPASPGSLHRRERQFGRFSRTLQLPPEIDPEQVAAECRNGVLTVRLGKHAAAKPRQISVRAA